MPNIHISEKLYPRFAIYGNQLSGYRGERHYQRLIESYKKDSMPIKPEEVISKPPRKIVTSEQVAEVYSCMKPVFDAYKKGEREGRLALGSACDYLATDAVGMNHGNASIYIRGSIGTEARQTPQKQDVV